MSESPYKTSSDAKPGGTLKRLAIRGTLLSLVGQGIAQGLRLLSNLILSRLLLPEAFGLMALVRMITTGLHMISDVGVQPSIIQHERGEDRDFLDTAWTLEVIRGAILWLIGMSIAYPYAMLYGEDQLTVLVPAAVCGSLIGGFVSTKVASLSRKMNIGLLVVLEVSGQVAAITAMVVHALIYRSVWSLVVGALVLVTVKVLLSHLVIAGPLNRFRWEKNAARDIFSFGKWIFLSTLINFLAHRLDIMLLGKLIALDRLGVYSIGIMLGGIPRQVAHTISSRVTLPALSASFREGHESLVLAFVRARRVILPLGLLAILGAALLAPPFFLYLYDDRYRDAGWIAELSMITVWFVYLHESSSRALLATGESRSLALSNLVRLIATTGASLAGFYVADLAGFMLGVALGSAFGYGVIVSALHARQLPTLWMDVRYTVVGLLAGLLATPVTEQLAELSWISWPLASLIAAVLILTPIGLWVFGRVRAEIKR